MSSELLLFTLGQVSGVLVSSELLLKNKTWSGVKRPTENYGPVSVKNVRDSQFFTKASSNLAGNCNINSILP